MICKKLIMALVVTTSFTTGCATWSTASVEGADKATTGAVATSKTPISQIVFAASGEPDRRWPDPAGNANRPRNGDRIDQLERVGSHYARHPSPPDLQVVEHRQSRQCSSPAPTPARASQVLRRAFSTKCTLRRGVLTLHGRQSSRQLSRFALIRRRRFRPPPRRFG